MKNIKMKCEIFNWKTKEIVSRHWTYKKAHKAKRKLNMTSNENCWIVRKGTNGTKHKS